MKKWTICDDFLRQLWHIIIKKNAAILPDCYAPLMTINLYAPYFNLSPLTSVGFTKETMSDLTNIKPCFKNISHQLLFSLRQHIFYQSNSDDIDYSELWAEKLLCFCEVRYSSLKKRAYEKWKNKTHAQLNMLHLTAFFLDYCVHSQDLRYLNIVLKLSDLSWIMNRKTIKNNLTNTGLNKEKLMCGLFQFRIILITQYIVRRVCQGKVIGHYEPEK